MANIFKEFRQPGKTPNVPELQLGNLPVTIVKSFDEPTYLTFRVEFLTDSMLLNTSVESTNYDKMPMPLFDKSDEEMVTRNHYSTINYLKDANEVGRAEMMVTFINQWNQIQKEFQWYFQEISGLDALFKVDPKRGIRISNKEGKVTFKMLEGLDWKITHLLNLYRKIAWDDTYQRWILPDMMRYFAMNIYITEFRSFHESLHTEQAAIGGAPLQTSDLILKTITNIMPTWVFHCERCEFDITSLNSYITNLKVGEETMTEVTFDVKVGQLSDEYFNPILNYWYQDTYLNGIGRTTDNIAGEIPKTFTKNQKMGFSNKDGNAGGNHISSRPFLETGGAGSSNIDNAGKAMQGPSADISSVDPVKPATWVGNALKFGKAFGTNLVESKIDKAKMSKIPGLGFSFTDAISALQSKNIFAVFALARQAITQSIAKTTPSQELDNKIIAKTLKQFLRGVASSQATTPPAHELVKAANQILNDKGEWEKLMDFSLATDLVSHEKGEVDIANLVHNMNTQKDITKLQTGDFLSWATKTNSVSGNSIIEGIPSSSTATNRNIEK